MEAGKIRKAHQVAKELKLTTPTILEFLKSIGLDVSRTVNSPVTEEIYVELLRKFDKNLLQQYQSEQAAPASQDKASDSKRLREQELQKIIDAGKEERKRAPAHKIELPKYHEFVVEGTRAEAALESESAAKEAAGEEKAKLRKRLKSAKTAAVKPVEEQPSVDEAKKAAKPSKPAEEPPAEAAKRKISLPKLTSLKIIQPAAAEAPRKLKRKRKVVTPDTTFEEVETKLEARHVKKEELKEGGKAVVKKAETKTVSEEAPRRKRRRRKRGKSGETAEAPTRASRRQKVDQSEVQATIRQTMSKMTEHGRGKRRPVRTAAATDAAPVSSVVRVTEFLTTQELANLLDIPYQDVIKASLQLGMLISINQRLERDLIELLASEFGVEVEFITEEDLDEQVEAVHTENLVKCPPVVTVMGHVDHGKTTLLDHLRRTKVAEGEAGGITQHIGAYEVKYGDERITFLDTPGHEAFTAMRAHGAQMTDIVVLVVAADDRVMPQTIEALNHARSAEVPIVIAVNKIDKPEANPENIYKQLADENVLVEKWGGKYQSAEISAKFGQGVEDLLAEILVAAEILDLKADPTARARGVVVESRLDRGLGSVATVLIQNGTLHIGDNIVIGKQYGRVRFMMNERNEPRIEAGPATPIQAVGFNGVPQAGDVLQAVESEREAREISLRRERQHREIAQRQIHALSLDQLNRRIKDSALKELPLVIKSDVHGSVEVLSDALMKLSNDEVKVDIVHRGVGGITESDVLLAAASQAILIGFHVHPNPHARETARREGVEIRVYRIIHEVVDDIRNSLEGLLSPDLEERHVGTVEVRKVFKISRIGNIAGCYVMDGKLGRKDRVKVLRDDVEIWSGELASLKRFKDDTREVTAGFECGLQLAGFNDIREGDRVEAFEIVKLARKLQVA